VAGARAVLALGPEVVIVTLGADGVVAVTADRVDAVEARVVDVVDTTGAGDGFVGALAAALARATALEAALVYATSAASLVVQRPGAAASMPSGAEIDRAAVRLISGS
jgi:ribokinase